MTDAITRSARSMLALGRMDARAAKGAYGPTFRGAIQHISGGGTRLRFHDDVRLIRDRDNNIVGAKIRAGGDWLALDYRKRPTFEGMTTVWQPPNMNLARRVRKPVEDRLAKALVPTNRKYATALGVDATKTKLSMRAATRLASAIVSEAIFNTVAARSDGNLTTLRSLPPSIRQRFAPALLAGTNRSDQLRDLLYQSPILACWPALLTSSAGLSPKKVLPQVGLPKSAAAIRAGAIAPLVHWNRVHRRDADKDIDLGWMTDRFCRALPDQMGLQRAVLDLCARSTIRGVAPTRTEAIGLWAAQSGLRDMDMGGLNRDIRRELVDYILAAPEILDRLGFEPWSDDVGLRRTIDVARTYAAAIRELKAGDRTPFERPRWAPSDGELPQSHWVARWLSSPDDLIKEGHEADNCVGGYAGECRAGTSAIYSLRRPARSGDRTNIRDEVIGGTIELVHRHGEAQVAQLEAPGNRPASTNIRQAVERWLGGRV